MKILMVLGRSTGGIGTHVRQLADDLRREGHEVLLVTDLETARHFAWVDAVTWWPRTLGGLLRWRGRLRRLAAGSDVVHAHGIQAGAAVALALPRRQPAVVVSLHNPPPTGGWGGRVGTALARVALRRANLTTGASADLVETARRLGATRTRLAPVPSPLVPQLLARPVPDAARRATLVEELDLGPGPLVLTVARLAPQKRLDVVVAALALMTHRPRLCWAVVGGGDAGLRADLEARGAGTGVVFLGPRSDVATLLEAASVLVVSSDWEARALVVQEAMAAGVPVLATRVGGVPDLLAGTGRLVPPGSPTELAAALDDLLDDLAGDDSGEVGGEVSGEVSGDRATGVPDGSVRVAEQVQRARELAGSWDDGPASARRWAQWYAATGP
ncbi:MAG: glycosyltransferase family 4 protein [Lapillicoccus sp.]